MSQITQQRSGGTASILDAKAYPHIVNLILDNAGRHGLLALRATCRAWRAHVDALLTRHVVLSNSLPWPRERLREGDWTSGKDYTWRLASPIPVLDWHVTVSGPRKRRLPLFITWDTTYSVSLPALVKSFGETPAAPLRADEWYAASPAVQVPSMWGLFASKKNSKDSEAYNVRQAVRRAASTTECFGTPLSGTLPRVVDVAGPVPRPRRRELLSALSQPFILRSRRPTSNEYVDYAEHWHMSVEDKDKEPYRNRNDPPSVAYQKSSGAAAPVRTLVLFEHYYEGRFAHGGEKCPVSYDTSSLESIELARAEKLVRNITHAHWAYPSKDRVLRPAVALKEIVLIFHESNANMGGNCLPYGTGSGSHILNSLFTVGDALLPHSVRITFVDLDTLPACQFFRPPLSPSAVPCSGGRVPLADYKSALLTILRSDIRQTVPPAGMWSDRPGSATGGSHAVAEWWDANPQAMDAILANVRFLTKDEYITEVGLDLYVIESYEGFAGSTFD